MDYEVTCIIFAKVKALDPDNASKIMGYILIQDFAEKDLVRLACGPKSILHSLIVRAKIHLGLCPNTSSTPSTPSPLPLNPIARPCANPFSQSSTRNGNLSSPRFSNNLSPGARLANNNISAGLFSSGCNGSSSSDLIDEHQLNEHLSFLNESSRAEDLVDPRLELSHSGDTDTYFHKRSYSASDVCFGSEESGFGGGFKPCLYYARGFCKNGSHCKFLHEIGDVGEVGSPSKLDGYDQHDEMTRLRAAQQQRLAASLSGISPLPFNKNMNYLLQQQNDNQRAAALIMGDDFYKFTRCRSEMNDFLSMASIEKSSSVSRQIYLTFPAESTFKDEDVSEYFSKFGPVQDVRIPYQQKRMFGFVTFVHPETVRFILSKGNPHFICDSRVLVKPYKEKGKILDKRQQQQQLERGDFSPCLSPSTVDSREPLDLSPGGRMFYNAQEILLRRKLKEQELQEAIELQGRRLMNLQLPDMKNDHVQHHQHSLSVGAHLPLTPQSRGFLPFDSIKQEIPEVSTDFISNPAATIPLPSAVTENQLQQEGIPTGFNNNGCNDEQCTIPEDLDFLNMEEALPDSLFASPTKSAATAEAKESTTFNSENYSSLSVTSTGCIALQ